MPSTAKLPGPDHPIAIIPSPLRVLVTTRGRVLADTRAALTLQESTYPPVLYIPRADVDMALLTKSDRTTVCPYKGVASYFTIAIDPERGRNAVWSYETPHEAVAAIEDHLAFYPDRVDSIEQRRG